MGLLKAIEGQSVYLDTNIFIYAVEYHPEFIDIVKALFSVIDRGAARAITSELTLARSARQTVRRQRRRPKVRL